MKTYHDPNYSVRIAPDAPEAAVSHLKHVAFSFVKAVCASCGGGSEGEGVWLEIWPGADSGAVNLIVYREGMRDAILSKYNLKDHDAWYFLESARALLERSRPEIHPHLKGDPRPGLAPRKPSCWSSEVL